MISDIVIQTQVINSNKINLEIKPDIIKPTVMRVKQIEFIANPALAAPYIQIFNLTSNLIGGKSLGTFRDSQTTSPPERNDYFQIDNFNGKSYEFVFLDTAGLPIVLIGYFGIKLEFSLE